MFLVTLGVFPFGAIAASLCPARRPPAAGEWHDSIREMRTRLRPPTENAVTGTVIPDRLPTTVTRLIISKNGP